MRGNSPARATEKPHHFLTRYLPTDLKYNYYQLLKSWPELKTLSARSGTSWTELDSGSGFYSGSGSWSGSPTRDQDFWTGSGFLDRDRVSPRLTLGIPLETPIGTWIGNRNISPKQQQNPKLNTVFKEINFYTSQIISSPLLRCYKSTY